MRWNLNIEKDSFLFTLKKYIENIFLFAERSKDEATVFTITRLG